MKAVIQAGGKGTRLRPYTLVLPKPLVPVGGLPVIEILLRWLRRNGVEQGYVTLGYLGGLIRAVCRDGLQWDMPLEYVEEHQPMGTLGALGLIGPERLDTTFFSLNGDIICDLNLREMAAFHKKHGGPLTVATARKDVHIDLGVMELDGNIVTNFYEKPVKHYSVSMGIYCMEPEILRYIPANIAFGFDDLIYTLMEKKIPIHSFPHEGMWMDIGRPEDYLLAQDVFEENQEKILGR